MLSTPVLSSSVLNSERLVQTFLKVPSGAETDFHSSRTRNSSNPSRSSSTRTDYGVDLFDNDISENLEIYPPVKLERTSISKVRQPPDGAIGDYGTLKATKKDQKGACGTKRTVDHAEPSLKKRQCIPGTEHSIHCQRFGLERFTTPAIQRREAASKKREATLQAQVEEEWAEAEKRAQSLEERIQWAMTKPPVIEIQPGLTIGTQKKNAAKAEKQWGNSMIGQTDNGQWSTLLGERLVYDILELRGESPRKVERKGGFEPDWETDNFIYEVKTSNWWVDGSAGEKVLGTWIKYQSIPELYGKPLRIICVANQEHELQYGKIKYFGPDVSTKTKQALELARSWGIEYITFSDLASSIPGFLE